MELVGCARAFLHCCGLAKPKRKMLRSRSAQELLRASWRRWGQNAECTGMRAASGQAGENADAPAPQPQQDMNQPVDENQMFQEVAGRIKLNSNLVHWDERDCSLADRLQRQADLRFQLLLAKRRLAAQAGGSNDALTLIRQLQALSGPQK